MVQTATPTGTLENTGSHWATVGHSSEWAALADASDSSYVTSAGHASAVLRLQLSALLRPHVRATTYDLVIRWRYTAGTFSTPPVVRLLDDASEEWVRVYHTAAPTAPVAGSFATATFAITPALIRGHRSNGGVYDFGDTGIEIQAPNGASGGAVLQIARVYTELEDVYPYSTQTNDIRVQRTGSTWQVVDVAGAITGGLGTWTNAPQLGEVLDNQNVVATAIYLAGFLPGAGTTAKVIGFAPGLPGMGGISLYGDDFVNKGNCYWKAGTVNSPGALKRIDRLLLRSESTTSAGRAQIATSTITPVGPFNNHDIDLGFIGFQSIRFYRFGGPSGPNYAISSPDEARSELALLGLYDCHLTGDGDSGPGSEYEMKTAYRGGYIGIDFMDCKAGTTWEHNYYHSGPTRDSQILRCENVPSTTFYTAHPLPDTNNGGVRCGRTFNQVVGRPNKCAQGGQGPPAQGTHLIEDCVGDWANFIEDSSALTYACCLADIVVRRVDLPNCGGGLVLCWAPATPAQPGIVHGFHLNSKTGDLGQFAHSPWSGSCGGAGQWGGAAAPVSVPQSGFVYHTGDVVIEEISGDSTSNSSAIRTGGCKSVLIVRGILSNTTKSPRVWSFPWNEVNNVFKWSSSGAGPWADLDVRFEVPASAASITAYYGVGTSGTPVLSNLMGYGSPGNPLNNTGGAGLIQGTLASRLTAAQINGLTVGGAQVFPPWAQPMAVESSGMRIGGLFPNMTAPTDYGPWKNAIFDPGKNTFTPQSLEHAAGDGEWLNGTASSVEMVGTPAARILVEPERGSLFPSPEMACDTPAVIRLNPSIGYLFLPETMNAARVTISPKRGHIEIEGGATEVHGTMDTAVIRLVAKRGDVIFTPTMTGDAAVVGIEAKRGHLTFEGAGGSVELVADPAVVRILPLGGGLFFSPEMTASNAAVIEIKPKRGHLTVEGAGTSIEVTMDPAVIRLNPELGSLFFSPFMTGDSARIHLVPQEGLLLNTAPLMSTGWAGASSKVRRALGDLIARPFSLGIQYDNDGANKFNTGRWCRLSVQHRTTKRSTATGLSGGVATGVIQRTGSMIAQLFAPIVEGDGELLAIAEFVESNLRSVTIEGVTYHVPSTERVGRTSDNLWWQVNTTVPFSFLQEIAGG